MEWVETTAKTVDEAKDLALDRLGVDEQDAEFEVLEEPRPGLFGRMRGEARVRARVRPVQPRPKADRRERRRGGRDAASGRGGGRGRGRQGASDAGAGDSGRTDDDAATSSDDDTTSSRPEPATVSGGRRARGGRGGSSRRDAGTTAAAETTDGEEPTMSDDDVTVEQQGEMVQEFVQGLVAAFGYDDAQVASTRIDDETVEVSVDGGDLGLLVGPKGATLQAIHDLSRTVVQRQASGNHEGRVRLDVAGYRERRRAALERFTHKVAEQVIASGTAQVLEPMAPADRKVVHDTANEIEGVRTTSEGDEPRRRVVVLPAD